MRQSPKEVLSKQYEVTYYDPFSRATATSLYNHPGSRNDWQDFFDYHSGAGFGANDIRYYLGYPYEGKHPADDAVSGTLC